MGAKKQPRWLPKNSKMAAKKEPKWLPKMSQDGCQGTIESKWRQEKELVKTVKKVNQASTTTTTMFSSDEFANVGKPKNECACG